MLSRTRPAAYEAKSRWPASIFHHTQGPCKEAYLHQLPPLSSTRCCRLDLQTESQGLRPPSPYPGALVDSPNFLQLLPHGPAGDGMIPFLLEMPSYPLAAPSPDPAGRPRSPKSLLFKHPAQPLLTLDQPALHTLSLSKSLYLCLSSFPKFNRLYVPPHPAPPDLTVDRSM